VNPNEQIQKLQQELAEAKDDALEEKILNEYLRQRIGQLNNRIKHLIRLGLRTTKMEHLDEWSEEEEL
jgi:hypothetical protein